MDGQVTNWGGGLGYLGWFCGQGRLSVDEPVPLSSKWGSSAVVLRSLTISVLHGCRLVPVVTSQGVGCNEDLLLVWGILWFPKGDI